MAFGSVQGMQPQVNPGADEYMMMPSAQNPNSNQQKHRYPMIAPASNNPDQLPSLIQIHRHRPDGAEMHPQGNSNSIGGQNILLDVNMYAHSSQGAIGAGLSAAAQQHP